MASTKWFVLALPVLLCLSGCDRSTVSASSERVARAANPLAGTWTGDARIAPGNNVKDLGNRLAGGPLTGPSRLELKAGGDGFLKVADQPERAIAWKQEGDRVLITPRDGGTDDVLEAGRTYVARLAESRHAMTIDLGDVRVHLAHSR